MTDYRVTYSYSDQGMEGRTDERDWIVTAAMPEEAIDIVVMREVPTDEMYGPNNAWSTREFFRLCLQVAKVTT